jgi:hypothetical protein
MDVTSKERRAASGDIPQSPLLNSTQADAGLLPVCRAVEAHNIGQLQHEDLGFKGLSSVHEVDR